MQFEDFEDIINYIEQHLQCEMTLDDISDFSFYSLPQIHRSFKEMMEYTFKEYIRRRRLSEAAIELVNTDRSILDIALNYQYRSHEAFSRAFKLMFSITPKEYRQNGILFGIVKREPLKRRKNLKLLSEIERIYQKYYENPASFKIEKELEKYMLEILHEAKRNHYSKESVNFAVKILFKMKKYKMIEELFNEYLKTVHSVSDENWARYNIMMIKYNTKENLFSSFLEYHQWIKEHMNQSHWFTTLVNTSVVLDFIALGKKEEYIEIVEEIRENAPINEENRQARFETSRSLVIAFMHFKEYEKVSSELKICRSILLEDVQDRNYRFNLSEYLTRKIDYLFETNQSFSEVVHQLISHINSWKNQIDELQEDYNKEFNQVYDFRSYDELRYDRNPLKGLRSSIHNIGCMFYRISEYQHALDMFNDPLTNGYLNAYSAGLYIGATYIVTNDINQVLTAMSSQTRILENNPDYWKKVKELIPLQKNDVFMSKLANLQRQEYDS